VTLLAVPFDFYKNVLEVCPTQALASSYMCFFQLPHPLPELLCINHGYIERLFQTWSPTWGERRVHAIAVRDELANLSAITSALNYYRANICLDSTLLRLFLLLLLPFLPLLRLPFVSNLIKYVPLLSHHPLHSLQLSNVERNLRCRVLQIGGVNDGCVKAELFTAASLDKDANVFMVEASSLRKSTSSS